MYTADSFSKRLEEGLTYRKGASLGGRQRGQGWRLGGLTLVDDGRAGLGWMDLGEQAESQQRSPHQHAADGATAAHHSETGTPWRLVGLQHWANHYDNLEGGKQTTTFNGSFEFKWNKIAVYFLYMWTPIGRAPSFKTRNERNWRCPTLIKNLTHTGPLQLACVGSR